MQAYYRYSKFNGVAALENLKISDPISSFRVVRQLLSAPPKTSCIHEFASRTVDINFPKKWYSSLFVDVRRLDEKSTRMVGYSNREAVILVLDSFNH